MFVGHDFRISSLNNFLLQKSDTPELIIIEEQFVAKAIEDSKGVQDAPRFVFLHF